MTTFDRYLLIRYFHVLGIMLIATIGLFTIVDGFMHLDDFQRDSDGTLTLFLRLGDYYMYQWALIADLAGPTMMVLSTMCVLAWMLKQGEIHPVLAAGVPTYRITLPLLYGVLLVNGLLAANQELILPRIAPRLLARHGATDSDVQELEPQYDPQMQFYVSGKGIVPTQRRLVRPEFIPLTPTVATDFVRLTADSAVYYSPARNLPGGWLLENLREGYQELPLTDAGRKLIVPLKNGHDVFIFVNLSLDQLSRQASNYRLVSTAGLFQRLQQPAGRLLSRRALLVHLHQRLTRPILTVIGLYLVIPLIIRREKMSAMQQVTNVAICVGTLGLVSGLSIGLQFLGQSGLLPADQSVWIPLFAGGGLAGWLSGVVRT